MLCESLWKGIWARWHSISDCQLVSHVGIVSEVGEGGIVKDITVTCGNCGALSMVPIAHALRYKLSELRCKTCGHTVAELVVEVEAPVTSVVNDGMSPEDVLFLK